jgi:hypothetical protein
VFTSSQDILGFIPIHYPFSLDYPAVRDIVVTMIYVVVLGLNVFMFSKWQKRNEVPTEVEGEPEKKSRFGRPLRAMRRRGAPEPVTASATAGAAAGEGP